MSKASVTYMSYDVVSGKISTSRMSTRTSVKDAMYRWSRAPTFFEEPPKPTDWKPKQPPIKVRYKSDE